MVFEAGRIFALVGWPAVLLVAWLSGELAHRGLGVPRVCAYALVGIASSALTGAHVTGETGAALSFLANFALGLFLFELGHRINLRCSPVRRTLHGEGPGRHVAQLLLNQAE